jgi:hypothetical protein
MPAWEIRINLKFVNFYPFYIMEERLDILLWIYNPHSSIPAWHLSYQNFLREIAPELYQLSGTTRGSG